VTGGTVVLTQSSAFGTPWLSENGGGIYFVLFSLLPLIVLLGLWLLLARTAFLQGDDMERPSRVAQLYGYTVCLIAVVVFLISTNSLVENAFTLANPVLARESEYGIEPSVSSFESYRSTYDRDRQFRASPGAMVTTDSVPETVLRARYEVLRADRIQRVRFHAQRALAGSFLSLILAIALFVIHWRWLRAPSGIGGTTPGEPTGELR
jgi:uncharacterized membrane protein YidH (DUF202 family)